MSPFLSFMPKSESCAKRWLWGSFLALALVILYKAWVAEDAFITARVIGNFIQGYGLRWNVDDRVEVYTHPLWMMIHIPFVALTGSFFYTTLAISLLITAAAFALITRSLRLTAMQAFPLLAAPLLLSRCITDYSTSGLETPLTFLLIAWFIHTLFHKYATPSAPTPWFRLSLIASLLLLNRLDTALLIAPALIYLTWHERRSISILPILAGAIPLFVWQIFRLFYYGFFFPNTKYAKLSDSVPFSYFLERGTDYLADFIANDLPSFMIILLSSLLIMWPSNTTSPFRKQLLSLTYGVLLYCVYIISAGGDYMTGRFFAPPVFLSIIVAATFYKNNPTTSLRLPYLATLLLFLALLFSLSRIMPLHPLVIDREEAAHFISQDSLIHDERAWGWSTNHLLSFSWLGRGESVTDNMFARRGLEFNKQAASKCNQPACYVLPYYAVGMTGFYAGPNVVILDHFALGDAFLSRLPVSLSNNFKKAGHYIRLIPPGYKFARESNSSRRMNGQIAEYYDAIRTITSDPLLSKKRLQTILDFNLGKYDHLLQGYKPKQATSY